MSQPLLLRGSRRLKTLDFVVAHRVRIAVVAIHLCLLVHGGRAAEFLVDMQIRDVTAKLIEVERLLRQEQNQLAGMTRIWFPTQADADAYDARRTELANDIATLISERNDINSCIIWLKAKRSLFPQASAGQSVEFYCSERTDIGSYVKAESQVLEVIRQLFPDTSLSFQNRPQVLIYETRDSFDEFEGQPKAVEGWTLTGRVAEFGGAAEWMNPRNQRLAFVAVYQGLSTDVVRHELAHVFCNRVMDLSQLSIKSTRPSRFLNEGFAENVAAVHNESIYLQRALSRTNRVVNAAVLVSMLDADTLEEGDLGRFYAEATVFVRWLSTLPEWQRLLRQLMTAKPGEHETILRGYGRAHDIEHPGFDAYIEWRRTELLRLQARREQMSTGATNVNQGVSDSFAIPASLWHIVHPSTNAPSPSRKN